ncbi:MAG: BNR-4 repeat-containing protein [Planctomycetes bacterium]|nr:BNR-4 repeat-containing protein [Planctomycetota bacterium]
MRTLRWSTLVLSKFVALLQAQVEEPPLLFGGCGGLYLLPELGPLTIEVWKRDLDRQGRDTELRAILVGPDRFVLEEIVIPDDGRPRGSALGPARKAMIETTIDRRGVYVLNVTVSQDRYGESIAWGFRTNCARYLVETARGHRDERHREPIVLAGQGGTSTIAFHPRQEAFGIEVNGNRHPVRLVDRNGTLVQTFEVRDAQASGTVPANVPRDALPWTLQLPTARATVTIDGLTQWDPVDRHPDQCVWSPDPTSWFPLLEHRWLLMPYQHTQYGTPGERARATFRVRNDAAIEKTIDLDLTFDGEPWDVTLDREQVTLRPGQTERVTLEGVFPIDAARVHLRATPREDSGFTTFSTWMLHGSDPPPFEVPLQLEPYRHENALYGHDPSYPVESQPYFDLQNRPYVVSGSRLHALRDGTWETTVLPHPVTTTKVAFDTDGDLYVLTQAGGKARLLHSRDGGRSFASYDVPGPGGTFDIEQHDAHDVPPGPPPFVRFRQTKRDPKLIWRRLNDLDLFVPRKVDGRIEIGKPIRITEACIGLSAHSGIPSTIVSRRGKVHVAYGEATDPDANAPGVPTYVATYDANTGQLHEPTLIGHGPPANDVHNSPSITMDSRGFLHVLIGTHGRPFQYCASARPDDASAFTQPILAGRNLRQTYIGFVCGPDDTLHCVYRLWRNGPPFPHASHATLAYQRKRPGEDWEAPRILVVAPFSEYGIFYHRLTIDRRGRLYLSKDYWSTYWFYRNDQLGARGHWRTLLTSPDAGDTWTLVEADDFRN